MDEPHGRDLSPDGPDDRSAVLSLLNSDAWQTRLNEARAAREKVLAARAQQPRPSATVTRLEPLILPRIEARIVTAPVSVLPVAYAARPPLDAPTDDLAESSEAFEEFDEDAFDQAAAEPMDEADEVFEFTTDVTPVRLERPVAPPPAGQATVVPVIARAAAALPAVRRPLSLAKIVFGFAVGLGAGIGATSVFWLWGGAAVAPLSAPSQAGPQGSQSIASPALSVGPGVATPPAPAAIAPLVTAAAALHPAPAPIAPAEDAPEVMAMLPGAGLQGHGRAEDRLPATPVIDMPLVRAAPMAPGLPVRATEPATAGAPLAAPAGVVLIVVLDAKQAQPETGALGAVSTAFAAISGVEPTPESWPPLPDGAPTAVALPPPPPVIEAAPAVASGVEDLPDLAEGGLVAPLPSHRVTVLAPPSLAEAIIGQTDDALRDAGFTTAEPKRVGVTISATHVRYYHADDRAVAERLAARFGGEARDFSRSDNASARGSIELWMEGSAPKPARVAKAKPVKKKSAPQRAQAPREDPQVRALRDKIVRNLQTGTTP